MLEGCWEISVFGILHLSSSATSVDERRHRNLYPNG